MVHSLSLNLSLSYHGKTLNMKMFGIRTADLCCWVQKATTLPTVSKMLPKYSTKSFAVATVKQA